MKQQYFIVIVFLLFAKQMLYSQEDGVVSFALPVRNSLKFNRYIINPTFSFVREQNSYVSLYSKRQWVQFEDAPQTYLFSYSGRFRENSAIALGVFQQNYGMLTTFGAVANYAHNVQLQSDSNLTFGVNLGFYKSGLNESKVITNYPDPSLDNIPSNALITINPGINYGTAFLDFGLSVNNLVLYNINTSKIVEDDPEKSIEAHIMHTGYIDANGFFDRSKFSGLLKTEFKKDKTIVSGLAMLNIPMGVWAQAGYNTLYGISGGIGLNITQNISFEYNYETGTGDVSNFGASHEIILAYKFKSKNNSYVDDEEGSVIPSADTRRTVYTPPKLTPEEKAKKEQLAAEVKVRRAAVAQAKLDAAEKVKADALAKPKPTTVSKPKTDAVAQSKLAADAKAKADALAKSKPTTVSKPKTDAVAQAKLAADAKVNAEDALAKAKLAADTKAKADALAQEKLAADAKAKADALAQAKLAADAKAKADALAQLKLAADAKAKADALAQEKLAADAKAKADALAQAKLAADAKAKADALAQAKLAADAKAKADAIAQAKLAADAKAKLDADAKAKADALAKTAVVPKDDIAKSMDNIAVSLENAKKTQQQLLTNLNATVSAKQKDLQEMKEENDLSEKGIFKEPKPFKSTAGESKALETLNLQIAEVNKIQNDKIKELEGLYNQRIKKVSDKNETLNQYYLKTIEALKNEQLQAVQSNKDLVSSLEQIKIATEIEKKRRIKKAAFVNEGDRFSQDKATLERIKASTPYSAAPLKSADFDYGEEQANMQILKSIKNVNSGYYLVVAVHSDVAKRDAFLTKTVAAGQTNINFFYDVNTSRYFIYYDKFDNIEEAKKALQSKGSTPYNGKMSIAKIEN
ncbi:MAG: PorP/SprF family type IX secretion system membrane protein [Flavobacterium sp.]|nr:PorP/SprF family type IX secretion system membrane protein [Flavobacterium sp.]